MLVIIVITELYLYKIMDIYYLAKELGTLHNLISKTADLSFF